MKPRKNRVPAMKTIAALIASIPGFSAAGSPDPAALPSGGQVIAGQASVVQSASRMDINQFSNKAIMNWNSFNIGSQAGVYFNQPGASSVVLNRVISSDPSAIFGRLSANGQIFLINPSGIVFGPGSSVSTGGIVASTLGIRDADFLSGNYRFTRDGTSAGILNQGTISADHGYAALLAPDIRNNGVIRANLGNVALAAGDAVTLSLDTANRLHVAVEPSTIQTLIENKELIQADGGSVLLSSSAAKGLLGSVIRNTGVIEANSIGTVNGEVVLLASNGTATVESAGRIEARGLADGETGGTVKLLGDRVGLLDSSSINASGAAGGGTVLVGGNFHGAGPEENASLAYVGPNASISANAVTNGNGGRVALWSDDVTKFYGGISATGGAQGGDGGFVETSAKNVLIASGNVNAGAPSGANGEWLLDPNNITIQSNGGVNTSVTTTGTAFNSNNNGAILDNAVLGAAITNGTNVVVNTQSAGTSADAGVIAVNAPVRPSASFTSTATLTLNAQSDITFSPSGSISATAGGGSGALSVNLNAGAGANLTSPGTSASSVSMASGSSIVTNGGNLKVSANTNGITLGTINTGNGILTVVPNGSRITLLGNITTTSTDPLQPLAFTAPVTLGAPVTISANAGNVFFGSTVDGANALTVSTTTGLANFNGSIGGTTALSSLRTTGNTRFAGGSVTTTGSQTYGSSTSNPVNFIGNTTLNAGTSIALNGAVNSGGGNMILNAGAGIAFNGGVSTQGGNFTAVSGAGDITSAAGQDILTTSNGVNSGSVNLSTTNGNITLNGGINTAGNIATNNNGGAVTLAAAGVGKGVTLGKVLYTYGGGGSSTANGGAGGNVRITAVDGPINVVTTVDGTLINGVVQTNGVILSQGGAGGSGAGATYNGGKGGDVTVQVTAPTAARNITIGNTTNHGINAFGGAGGTPSAGFAGGQGGSGGNVVVSTTSNGSVSVIPGAICCSAIGIYAAGGQGGNGTGAGFNGGSGGNGGTINIDAYGANGNIQGGNGVTTAGGKGGDAGGAGATGGNGGSGGQFHVTSHSGTVTLNVLGPSGGAQGGSGGAANGGVAGTAGTSATGNTITAGLPSGPLGTAAVTISTSLGPAGSIQLPGTTISNSGTSNEIRLISDNFLLAGGSVLGGSGNVVLSPATPGNALSVGDNSTSTSTPIPTKLTNADIAAISTTGSVTFGGSSNGYTGNITVGASEQVNGGTKNLTFITNGGNISIGALGVTTSGNEYLAIIGTGSTGTITGAGTIVGNNVALNAISGIGTGTGGRLNVTANTLAANTRATSTPANIFLASAGPVNLSTVTTSTGVSIGNRTGGGGTFDLSVSGTGDITGAAISTINTLGDSGAVSLATTNGNITLNGPVTTTAGGSTGSSTNGGAVTLVAAGTGKGVTVRRILKTTGGTGNTGIAGTGGDVTITAVDGPINIVTAADLSPINTTGGIQTNGVIDTNGGNGGSGTGGTYNGGKGGDVTVKVTAPTTARDITIGNTTNGGIRASGGDGGSPIAGFPGGQGGAGGNALVSTTSNGSVNIAATTGTPSSKGSCCISIDAEGGAGGNGAAAGDNGGKSGNGGTIDVLAFGTNGNVSLSGAISSGGADGGAAGGSGGVSGSGGNAAPLHVTSQSGTVSMNLYWTLGGNPGAANGGSAGTAGANATGNTITAGLPSSSNAASNTAVTINNNFSNFPINDVGTTISNSGTNNEIRLISDNFVLAGGSVLGGSGNVVLRPVTPGNALSVGDTSTSTSTPIPTRLINADIAAISTTGSVTFGGSGNGYTGNITVGTSEQVIGGTKNLIFVTGGGNISIGALGVTTSGNEILATIGTGTTGTITGSGTVAGNNVALNAISGIGTGTGGRLNVSATALAATTTATSSPANIFLASTGPVNLSTLTTPTGVSIGNGTGGGGTFDLSVSGAGDITSAVGTNIVTTQAGANSGAVNLSTTNGNITLNGGIITAGAPFTSNNGGAITLAAAGAGKGVTLGKILYAYGGGGSATANGGAGGNVTIKAVDGPINIVTAADGANTNGVIITSGGAGGSGTGATYNGGKGGDVTVQVTAPTAARDITIGNPINRGINTQGGAGGTPSAGFAGGQGGAGGNVVVSTTSNGSVNIIPGAVCCSPFGIFTAGGRGGNGTGAGFNGGSGGNGGAVNIDAYGATGNLQIGNGLTAMGGAGGAAGGAGATGGNGGSGAQFQFTSHAGTVTMDILGASGGAQGGPGGAANGGVAGTAGTSATGNTITARLPSGPIGTPAVTITTSPTAGINGAGTTISNSGTSNDIRLISDYFSLQGLTILGGSGNVLLRPATNSNTFGIEDASMQTHVNNADIAAISTTGSVTFGGAGSGYTGNITAGTDAQVNGGAKNLTFGTSGGNISIGALGVTTGGNTVLTSAGTISGTGTISGASLALKAGTSINAVTAANLLAAQAPGGVSISNKAPGGTLTIGTAGGLTGITATNSAISVSEQGNLGAVSPVNASGGTVTLSGGQGGGGKTISIAAGGTLSGSTVRINGGTGNDTFDLSADPGSTLTLAGGGGTDTLMGRNATNAWTVTGINAGNVASTGTITFSGITNIAGGTGTDTLIGNGLAYRLTGPGSGVVTNAGPINWTSIENLTDTGAATFTGSGGSISGALTGTGTATLNGTLSVGSASLGTTTLGSDAAINAGTGAVSFGSTVNGAFGLSVNTSGTTTFSGAVGGTTALASLTTDAPGSTSLGANVITTGGQTYNDAVSAGAVTFTSTGGGTINASNAANAFTGALTLNNASGSASIANPGSTTIGGNVGGNLTVGAATGPLSFATTTVGGNLVAASKGQVNQTGPLAVKGTSAFTGGGNTILLTNSQNSFGGAVSLTDPGNTSITAASGLRLDSVNVGGALTAVANANGTSTQALDLGSGTIGGALAATSNGGDITWGSLGSIASPISSVVLVAGAPATTTAAGTTIPPTNLGNITAGSSLYTSGTLDLSANVLAGGPSTGNMSAVGASTYSINSLTSGTNLAVTLSSMRLLANSGTFQFSQNSSVPAGGVTSLNPDRVALYFGNTLFPTKWDPSVPQPPSATTQTTGTVVQTSIMPTPPGPTPTPNPDTVVVSTRALLFDSSLSVGASLTVIQAPGASSTQASGAQTGESSTQTADASQSDSSGTPSSGAVRTQTTGGSTRSPLAAAEKLLKLSEEESARHNARDARYKVAIEVLRKSPTMADLPLCGPSAPEVCMPAEGGIVSDAAQASAEMVIPATDVQRKTAILFGNNEYVGDIPALGTPLRDVTAIGKVLSDKFGYNVTVIPNASKADIVKELRKLADQVTRDESVLIFYAGHGYQLADSKAGFWIPVDAKASDPATWVSNNDVQRFLNRIDAKQISVVSDSCFSGTLTKEQSLNAPRNASKEQILAKRAVVTMSSGDEEPVSDDGLEGHSIFAYHFMNELNYIQQLSPISVTYERLLEHVSRTFPQTPQIGGVASAGHMNGANYLFEVK